MSVTTYRAARLWIAIAALSGAVAVGLGAFGSHGLRNVVSPGLLSVWRTAVDYQFFHTLALLVCALHSERRRLSWAMWLWLAGIILFSGLLYALVLTGNHALGMVTPLGGTAFILGWLVLVWAAWQRSVI